MNDLCQFLQWDTDFFGVRIARVTTRRLTPDSIKAIEAWCEAEKIACLYFLADMDDPHTTRLAEHHHFRMVDIRVTLNHKNLQDQLPTSGIRFYQNDDLPMLMKIARVSYTDSRYYFDFCFPNADCDALYEAWIRQSCENPEITVLVAELDGRPAGFITCLMNNGVGQIGLVGVDEAARGKSIGQSLVTQALNRFKRENASEVTVVTQGRNIAAQRLYQRCGFVTRDMQIWYHRWFRGCW